MDVYCFGHVSTGRLIRLKGKYPAPDGYAEIESEMENHSGEATGSALVLARLGASVRLEGNWIGDNPECQKTVQFLTMQGIDTGGLRIQKGYPGVREWVIADGESRTVLGRYCDLLFTTPQWDMPSKERMMGSRIAIVDPAFGEATLMVARFARELGIPLVTCDAAPDSELTRLSGAVVVSGEFLAREFPECLVPGEEREQLFRRYQSTTSGLVVFTDGSRRVLYGRSGERCEQESFVVDVVDSTGAGDAFRGGLAWGFLQGWKDVECIRYACGVAALVCTTAPGCLYPPSSALVGKLLSEQGLAL